MKPTLAILIASTFFLTGTAEASSYSTSISRGIKSGQLTRAEATNLKSLSRSIATYRAKAKRDGRISSKERRKAYRAEFRQHRAVA